MEGGASLIQPQELNDAILAYAQTVQSSQTLDRQVVSAELHKYAQSLHALAMRGTDQVALSNLSASAETLYDALVHHRTVGKYVMLARNLLAAAIHADYATQVPGKTIDFWQLVADMFYVRNFKESSMVADAFAVASGMTEEDVYIEAAKDETGADDYPRKTTRVYRGDGKVVVAERVTDLGLGIYVPHSNPQIGFNFENEFGVPVTIPRPFVSADWFPYSGVPVGKQRLVEPLQQENMTWLVVLSATQAVDDFLEKDPEAAWVLERIFEKQALAAQEQPSEE